MTSHEDEEMAVQRRAIDTVLTLERSGQLVPVMVSPMTAFTVIGQLQLALRHPHNQAARASNNGLLVSMIDDFIRTLAATIGPDVLAYVDLDLEPTGDVHG